MREDARIGALVSGTSRTRLESTWTMTTRPRNSAAYRLAHWPIWAGVFFILPGPWIVQLLADGFGWEHAVWLGAVAIGTGLAGLFGKLPGVEPTPYVGNIGEDKPNPLYRRICYTAAWTGVLTYALLNLAGLADVLAGGNWHLQKMYRVAYFPVAGIVCLTGAFGFLPMTKASTRSEAQDRPIFYGLLAAVLTAQPILGILSQVLPQTRVTYAIELAVFLGACFVAFPAGRRFTGR